MALLEALTVGGSLLGGLFGSSSAKKAAKYQAAAIDRATAEQRRQYDVTRADFQPYRQSGTNALSRLDRASTGDMSDFYVSPDYNFRKDEGTRGLTNVFAGGPSGVYSGNAMRALNEFNSGLAAGEYGNWWNRQSGMADRGMGATTNTAAFGQQATNNISNLMQQRGNVQAQGAYNSGMAINNAVQGGISNYLYGQGAGLWGQQKKQVQNGIMLNGGLVA